MKQHNRLLRHISDSVVLQGEPLPMLPILELADDRRILIENHRGVTEYEPCRIKVLVRFGTISICGSCLELRQMSKNQLVITGRINQIAIDRRKC